MNFREIKRSPEMDNNLTKVNSESKKTKKLLVTLKESKRSNGKKS